jgi:hypothetical protein
MTVFVGPRPERLECRHLDGDKANNRVENLRYGTRKENAEDMTRHGGSARGERHPQARLTEQDVREIRVLLGQGKGYAEIGRQFRVWGPTIRRIALGRGWTHVK